MRDHRVTSLFALALAVALAVALALAPPPAHAHQVALRFDFRGDIETRVETRRAGCEADVLAHFTALVGSRDSDRFRDEFERGVRLAWVCSTIAVKRPCGIGGLMSCDKRACFGSLLAGGDGEHVCSFTDDDHLGFKAVEASVHDRFQRELAERQMEIAESTLSAIAAVGYAVSDVGEAMANVSDQQTVLLEMGDEMLTKQDELSDQQDRAARDGQDEMLSDKQDQAQRPAGQAQRPAGPHDGPHRGCDGRRGRAVRQGHVRAGRGRADGKVRGVLGGELPGGPRTRWPRRRATSPSRS